uniref:Uncharacterized protein n=1 Tax=Rhizophora mucronata TaxID=61149 RepID=A0A2P2PUG2_RHIMU
MFSCFLLCVCDWPFAVAQRIRSSVNHLTRKSVISF